MTDTTNDLGTSNDISILGQILQTPALKAYEEKMCEFNPFAALRLKDYEIRHTNALAWLLDAQGSHGLGDKFLLKFLGKVSEIAKERNIKSDFSLKEKVKITAEDRFSENHPGKKPPNRLDIWLEGNDWAIALEAKIDSSEGKNQLGNYFDEIVKRFTKREKAKKTIYLFLTLDKSKPESESRPQDYEKWDAVSWLGLVAESLVEALPDGIDENNATYEQRFLLSYLDVIYEKSTREFEVAGNLSPRALKDKNERDRYLEKVKRYIHDQENSEIKRFLIELKDEWEQYKAKRAKETKKAEKIGKKEFFEEFCDAVMIREGSEQLKDLTDFQSTLQFLLDQVDSTVEGRMRKIRDAINPDGADSNQVFEILSSSFCSISFMPKNWLQDEYLQRRWLIFYVQYKEWKDKPTQMEFKLYFPSHDDPEARIWRKKLCEQLAVYNVIFNVRGDIMDTVGEVKIITSKSVHVTNFNDTLSAFNEILNEKFIPAIPLVLEAAKVSAPQQ